MTKTKQDSSFDDNEDTQYASDSIKLTSDIDKSVVNVEFLGNDDDTVLKLDVVSLQEDEGRYSSYIYNLSTKNGSNGLFDFLDDYYSKKFGFFASGKTPQAFLVALHKLEQKLYNECMFTFKEYCETISDTVISKVASDSKFNNFSKMCLLDGYGIELEAKEIYDRKHSSIGIGCHIEEIGKKIKKEFDKILKTINDKKFCCVCVNNTDKIPPSFLIDPLLGLPLLIYNLDFAKIFLKSNFEGFIKSEFLKKAEIYDVMVDVWAVAPDTSVDDIMSIIKTDGELGIEYTPENMEETDLVLGKYKTLKFNEKSYDDEFAHQTVIGNH